VRVCATLDDHVLEFDVGAEGMRPVGAAQAQADAVN
jgi:hypothetical protein